MNEFFVGAVAIAVVICSIILGGVYAGIVSTKSYYAAVNHCTDAGGMWIPNHDAGICLRK